MSITAHTRTEDDTSAKMRFPMLASPLAALVYPFALKGFNASVTRIPDVGAGAFALSWLSAAVCLALAFTVPLIAMLAAMSLSRIGQPTAAQLHAKRAALRANLVHLHRRRSLHATRSGARHVALGRVLDDCARAVAAV